MATNFKEAKQEVFDDLERSDFYQEHIVHCDWYHEMKKKHLGLIDKEGAV